MSKFSERLEDLIYDHNLNKKMLAKYAGVNATCLSHYILDKHIPTVESLIKLADYFQCSTDFLLGREEESDNLIFKKCPPFSEQILILKNKSGYSAEDFYTTCKIAKSTYYNWLSGKQPTLENIIHLADVLDRRVDYVLGREN